MSMPMDKVIDELNQFLDTCATCPTHLQGRCLYIHGAIDRCQAYDLEPDNVLTYSAQQIMAGHGPYQVQPSCDDQINVATLFSHIESDIDDAEVYLTKDWLMKLLSKLHAVKEKAWQNSRDYQQMFVPVILVAIEKILAKIDLLFLQNHINVGPLLEVSNFNYSRQEALKAYCPEGLVSLYLQEALPLEGVASPGRSSSDSGQAGRILPEEAPSSKYPKYAAIKEFKLWLSDKRNQDLVERVLMDLGYEDVVGDFYLDEEEHLSEEEEKEYEKWLKMDFRRWDELKKNIEDSVCRNWDNEIVLQKYIRELLESCKGFARYYYPGDTASLREKEAAALLKLLETVSFDSFEELEGIWNKAREDAKQQIVDYRKHEKEYVDIVYRLALEEVLELGHVAPILMLKRAGHIRTSMSKLAMFIECALYRFLPWSTDCLLYYEDQFGISISEDISIFDIRDALEYPPEYKLEDRSKRYKQYLLSSDDESSEDGNNPSSESDKLIITQYTEKTPPKVKAVGEKLNTRNANTLYAMLRKEGYTKAEDGGVDLWLKPKELYAYFCHKLMDVFAHGVKQIEITYIYTNIIYCPGNLETIRSYAGRMRRGEMNPPDHYKDIDNLINGAYAGHYGQ